MEQRPASPRRGRVPIRVTLPSVHNRPFMGSRELWHLHRQIPPRRRHRGVPERILNQVYRRAPVERMRRMGMPQPVGRHCPGSSPARSAAALTSRWTADGSSAPPPLRDRNTGASGKTILSRRLRADLEREGRVIVSRSLSIDKTKISLPLLEAALFYDLTPEKTVKISSQSERRERDLQELFRRAKKPVVLFVDDAHDLHPTKREKPGFWGLHDSIPRRVLRGCETHG